MTPMSRKTGACQMIMQHLHTYHLPPVLCLQSHFSDLELPGLTKLRRLRLSNIAAGALIVAPGCQISIRQWSYNPVGATMCKTAHPAMHSTTWELPKVM